MPRVGATTTDSPCTGSGVVGVRTVGAGVPGSVGAGVGPAAAGGAGATGAAPVVLNAWSAPTVVPFEFVARNRTWYTVPGASDGTGWLMTSGLSCLTGSGADVTP